MLLHKVEMSHAPNFDGDGCVPRVEFERDWQRVVAVDACKVYRDNAVELVVPGAGVRFQGDVCIRCGEGFCLCDSDVSP